MQIYIYRKKEKFGPYSQEAVLEYLRQGIFEASDKACFTGMSEWKTVGELLGIEAPQAAATPAVPKAGKPAPPAGKQTMGRRRTYAAPTGDKKNLMIVLNVGLIMVVVAAAYVRWGTGAQAQKMRHYFAGIFPALAPAQVITEPGPEPAATPVIIRVPALKAATPVVVVVVVATPRPVKPFDPVELAGNPAAWPKTLRLKQEEVFPVVFDSQVHGSVTVPSGTDVKLLSVDGEQVVVDYQGGTQRLSWKVTDLEEAVKRGR